MNTEPDFLKNKMKKQAGWIPKMPSVVLRRTDSKPRGSACIHALLRGVAAESQRQRFLKSIGYWKVAPTFLAAVMVTMQLPVPEQAPLHPLNRFLAAGVAVSVTVVPALKPNWHVDPQLMPRGLLLTLPLPDFVTVRA